MSDKSDKFELNKTLYKLLTIKFENGIYNRTDFNNDEFNQVEELFNNKVIVFNGYQTVNDKNYRMYKISQFGYTLIEDYERTVLHDKTAKKAHIQSIIANILSGISLLVAIAAIIISLVKVS